MSWLTKIAIDLPRSVLEIAEIMSHANPNIVGDSKTIDGYWIESHTIGCRNAADEHPNEWWKSHWSIYDEYANDPQTTILGDPADGIFVTITPLRKGSQKK